MIHYNTKGTCSRSIDVDVSDGVIRSVLFEGGCQGNLSAVGKLVEGMPAGDAIAKLEGIECGGRGTSCADQLARALKQSIKQAS